MTLWFACATPVYVLLAKILYSKNTGVACMIMTHAISFSASIPNA